VTWAQKEGECDLKRAAARRWRRQEGFCPRAFCGNPALREPCLAGTLIWDSGLQNSGTQRINFVVLRHPVGAVTRN
jgi:hypothetical protein